MANESIDRTEQIRRASRMVARDVAVGASMDRLAHTIASALLLVDARPDVATGERDERTRDLEALTSELEASKNGALRLQHALAKMMDERDACQRRAELAEVCERKSAAELMKTRALVDELRERLTAPTVQSAAVKAWLALKEGERAEHVRYLRLRPSTNAQRAVADVLDSLSMQATHEDERACVPTEAADEVARLRTERDSLQACNDRQRTTIERLHKRLHEIANCARDLSDIARCAGLE